MIIESNDVNFFEDRFPFKLRNSGGLSSNSLISGGSSSSSQPLIRTQTLNEEVDP